MVGLFLNYLNRTTQTMRILAKPMGAFKPWSGENFDHWANLGMSEEELVNSTLKTRDP